MSHYRPRDGKDGIPGLEGKQGPQGPLGPEGEKGEQGERGEQGPQGEQGPKGDTGDQGPKGDTGPKGANGDTGSRGPAGKDGEDGERGEVGPMPEHQWRDTSLRFEDPDGTWGKWVDLKGPQGLPGASGGVGGKFNATKAKIAHLPGSTYSTVQNFVDTMHSPGIITGGEISQLDVDTVRISAGTGMVRIADDDVSLLPFFDFPQQDFDIPADQDTRYFAVTYNGGSPTCVMQLVDDWDRDTEIPLGSAVRFNGTMVVTPNKYRMGDPITNIIQRFDAQSPAIRDAAVGGLQLGETGTRNVLLTGGRIWARLSDFDSAPKNSSTDPMLSVFFNGVGLTFTSGITQWDNQNYNNMGTGALVAVGNNKWANLWFFCSIDGSQYGWAYGTADYNSLGAAANEIVPAYLTQDFFNQALLLGRFVFQEGAATAGLIESAFNTLFSTSAVNNHNDLAGLQGGTTGEYYHLTSAQQADVAALSTGGTTGQFWRGDQVYSNELVGQMIISHAGAPAPPGLILNRTSSATNSCIECRTTGGSIFFGLGASPQSFTIGTTQLLSTATNRLYNVTPTMHTWYTGLAGAAIVNMSLADTGVMNVAGSTASVLITRDGTAEGFFRVRNQTSGSGGDVRGLDAGGIRIADMNATVEFARFQAAATVINEGGVDTDFRVEGDSLTHLFFTDGTATTENIALVAASAPNWQSMDRGLFLGNSEAAPTGNPTSGVFIYAEAGAAKCRGASGTVTTFGPASPHCSECGSDFVHEWENESRGYGYLAVCMNCFAEGRNSHTRIKGEWGD